MADSPLIPRPRFPVASKCRYRVRPRPNRSFHTALDAHDIFHPSGAESTVRIEEDGDDIVLNLQHPLKLGTLRERLVLGTRNGGMVSKRLERRLTDPDGVVVRTEDVDFTSPTLPLPGAAYPEVMLPFVLSWQAHDGVQRSLYAWINDRFVAKTQYRSKGVTTVDLPGGRREAIHQLMWPDLNDWVSLGRVLTKMAYPFVPKYRMWFDPRPPHRVLRYEGPYGPPGAPEVILEFIGED